MQKIIALGILALFVVASVPSIAAQEDPNVQRHSYIPGPSRLVTVWCSEAQHSGVPIEGTNPEDYEPEPSEGDDDIDNATRPADGYLGWGFSGEPECEPHDYYNDYQESQGNPRQTGGYGGAAYTVTANQLGMLLTISTLDDNFGTEQYIRVSAARTDIDPDTGNRYPPVTAEGCGPQAITLPEDMPNHWQSSQDNPLFLSWVRLDVAMVDQADLTVCFSSTGIMTGVFSTPVA